MTEENKAFIRRFLMELDKDLSAVGEFFSPDCVAQLPGSHGPANREGFKQFVTLLYTVFPDLRHTVEDQIAEGDKEERVLFPSIRRKEGKADIILDGPIRQMELEHENAGRALAAMRELTSGYRLPPDACPSFGGLFEGVPLLETDLHEHIHLENNILFPRALETRGNACSVRKGQK